MKQLLSIVLAALCCSVALADDVPIALGTGSDTVWFKTGKNLSTSASSVVIPEYGAMVFYAPDKTVESIILGLTDASTKYTLHGVGLGEAKKDVVSKLGAPAKEFSKDANEIVDAYQDVWVLGNQLLIVGFWQADQATPDKHAKDHVAWITLRKAYF